MTKTSLQTVNVTELVHVRILAVILAAFCLYAFTLIHPAFIIIGAGIIGAVVLARQPIKFPLPILTIVLAVICWT